jgi:hypothetical protein
LESSRVKGSAVGLTVDGVSCWAIKSRKSPLEHLRHRRQVSDIEKCVSELEGNILRIERNTRLPELILGVRRF